MFSAGFTKWENVLEVLNCIFVFLFAILVLLLDAFEETSDNKRMAAHLNRLIAKKSTRWSDGRT